MPNPNPKAGIIITTRNRPHLVPRAMQSAQASGSDVEIVVVDDASSDETAAVCKDLSGINYVRVEHNQGVAGERTGGSDAATGPGRRTAADHGLSRKRETSKAVLPKGRGSVNGRDLSKSDAERTWCFGNRRGQ
jgi:cellulose synthase/poly-beta-1,6-N-acetylglucosamine synthase-like glycosyltransferase